jgi:hypothetical protein
MKYIRKFNENIISNLQAFKLDDNYYHSRKGKDLMAVTVKTLPSWDEHEEYPELTFILNATKGFCESCNALDYGTPFCSTHCDWCLNCMQNMGEDVITDEDAKQIHKLAEENE